MLGKAQCPKSNRVSSLTFISLFLISVVALYIEAFFSHQLSMSQIHLSGVLDDQVRSIMGTTMFSVVSVAFIWVESCRHLDFYGARLLFARLAATGLILSAVF